jgi:hypothetical protein
LVGVNGLESALSANVLGKLDIDRLLALVTFVGLILAAGRRLLCLVFAEQISCSLFETTIRLAFRGLGGPTLRKFFVAMCEKALFSVFALSLFAPVLARFILESARTHRRACGFGFLSLDGPGKDFDHVLFGFDFL